MQCNNNAMCKIGFEDLIPCSVNETKSGYVQILYNCARQGGWSEWIYVGPCSASCGGGLQTRFRECTNPAPNEFGNACDGYYSTQQICNNQNCVFDSSSCINETVTMICQGGYIKVNDANWRSGSVCAPSTKFQSFDVTRQIQSICSYRRTCMFRVEDATFNFTCQEPDRSCSQFDYVYTCHNARWDECTEWTECPLTCGIGTQFRNRSCLDVMNTLDGYMNDCDGSPTETRQCYTNTCTYNGNWGGWSLWTPCTITCGGGIQNRTRLCNSPSPTNGGLNCSGISFESTLCNTLLCPEVNNNSKYSPTEVGGIAVMCIILTAALIVTLQYFFPKLRIRNGGGTCYGQKDRMYDDCSHEGTLNEAYEHLQQNRTPTVTSTVDGNNFPMASKSTINCQTYDTTRAYGNNQIDDAKHYEIINNGKRSSI